MIHGSAWWLGFWATRNWTYWWLRAPQGGSETGAPVAGGRIPREALEPLLAACADAVPISRSAEVVAMQQKVALHERRVNELLQMEATMAGLDVEAYRARASEKVLLALHKGKLDEEAVRESLDRSWAGPLGSANAPSPYPALGRLLLPPMLCERLLGDEPPPTLIIAPAPDLAIVPWELLQLPDGSFLIERAVLRRGISPATTAHLALPAAPDRPELPGLLVIDPTSSRESDGGFDRQRNAVYPHGLPEDWTHRLTNQQIGTLAPRQCSRVELGRLLRAGPWGRFLFFGHATAGDRLSGTDSALMLASGATVDQDPITTSDGRALEAPGETSALSARVWLHQPNRWPVPRRVGIVACQADDGGYVEQTGLTLAAINAGARTVITTRWPLPADASVPNQNSELQLSRPTTALALAVDEALLSSDPVKKLREWQLHRLRSWRAASTTAVAVREAPLLWASLVSYVLPDRVSTVPLIGEDGNVDD